MKMRMNIDKPLTLGALIGWFVLSPLILPKYFNSINSAILWSILGLIWSIMLGMLGDSLKTYLKIKRKLDELKIEIKIMKKIVDRQEEIKKKLLKERKELQEVKKLGNRR
jgi:hypothetical protein